MLLQNPLMNESDLLNRCRLIEGLSLAQLAARLSTSIPLTANARKGWAGQAIEYALGATAGNRALPDFDELGIELKTLPLNHLRKPSESTFVTSVSLLTIHTEQWQTSQCYSKLKRVLWIPVEADKSIPFQHRRIGRGILWSPTAAQEKIFEQDWLELTWMMCSGRLAEIHAGIGQYLQIRPKGANKKALCSGFDENGNKIQTLPRGFYLRSSFTATLLGCA